jgi:hypothetical protein
MSHAIRYLDYHCSTSEKSILKDIRKFAYDPQESGRYHENMTFHKEPVYANREEAEKAIKKLDNGWYDDHSVRYKQGRKIFWLCKVEWHC